MQSRAAGDAPRAAIYCRLSEEDADKADPGQDSRSIQNQKSMLVRYAVEQGWQIYNIYSDDDYTGSDRERPQFNRLLEDARRGCFDIVLCKSQSRFTREMELVEKYEAAMEDDFNTADAVSAVFELVKLSNSTASAESTGAYVGWMKETIERLCGVLGIITEKKEEILDSEIEDMIAQRQAARKAKDFALADQIRGKLLDMGIILEDTREGVKWKQA